MEKDVKKERNSSMKLPCGASQWHPYYFRKTASISSRETILPLCSYLVRPIWSAISSPVQERHGQAAVGSVNDPDMIEGLEHLLYKKRQREMGLLKTGEDLSVYQCEGQGNEKSCSHTLLSGMKGKNRR